MNTASKNETPRLVEELAQTLVLGSLLDRVREIFGSFEIVDHWTQGEFHHDLVLRVPHAKAEARLDGDVLVVATNCNGGVKEVLSFTDVPERQALWAMRCPDNDDFAHEPAMPLERSRTVHWFDPCELLTPDARSELRPEHRVRQPGGGWTCSRK